MYLALEKRRNNTIVLLQLVTYITYATVPVIVKLCSFSYRSGYTYVLGTQKSRLIKTVLLSTHNIYFGLSK